MAAKKKEGPKTASIEDLIKEADKREDLVTDYINTYQIAHNDAYKTAITAVGGKASSLRDAAHRTKFVDAAAKFYIDQFKKEYGAKFEDDFKGLKEEDALFFMSGATRDVLQGFVNEHQNKYTADKHDALKGQHKKELEKRHGPYILQHILPEHKDLISKAAEFKGAPALLENVEKLKEVFANYRQIHKAKKDLSEIYTK
jgi:hypothetical protein